MNTSTAETSIEMHLDMDGRITSVSPVIEHTIGYHATELVGQPFDSLVHFEDVPSLKASWLLALAGDIGSHEIRLLGKYGEVHRMRARSRPLFSDGRTIGLCEVMTDITAPSEN